MDFQVLAAIVAAGTALPADAAYSKSLAEPQAGAGGAAASNAAQVSARPKKRCVSRNQK